MKRLYEADVIRQELNTKEARKALFELLKSGNKAAVRRTIQLFCDRMLIVEAGKIVDWHIKAELGELSLRHIKF